MFFLGILNHLPISIDNLALPGLKSQYFLHNFVGKVNKYVSKSRDFLKILEFKPFGELCTSQYHDCLNWSNTILYTLDFNQGIYIVFWYHIYVNHYWFKVFLMASHHGLLKFLNTLKSFADNFLFWKSTNLPKKEIILTLTLIVKGYLPSSPYTLKFGVEVLNHN